jgi:hypothetical protein
LSRVCLELEGSDLDFAPVTAPVRDPEEAKPSESECEGSDGDDGSAGLLSSLFISTTDATDVEPSDTYPADVCGRC